MTLLYTLLVINLYGMGAATSMTFLYYVVSGRDKDTAHVAALLSLIWPVALPPIFAAWLSEKFFRYLGY